MSDELFQAHRAAMKKHIELVLSKKPISNLSTNNNGFTAFDVARMKNRKDFLERIEKSGFKSPSTRLSDMKAAKIRSTTAVGRASISIAKTSSPDIFISYQWDKKPQIKALYKKLTERGYTCWMDDMQMGGGDRLYTEIEAGIRGCKVMLSCVTESYSRSENCRKEVSLAQDRKKPIIPLVLEKMEMPPKGPMGFVMTGLVYINFCRPDVKVQEHWQCPQMAELISAINERMPGTQR